MGSASSQGDRGVGPTENGGNHSAIPKTLHNVIDSKVVVIWLDADANDSDIIYQNSIARLQRFFVSFHLFTNVKECVKFLSTIRNETVLMVISEDFFQDVWPRIQSMTQVHAVYILSLDGEEKVLTEQEYNKVKGIFTRVEPICSSLKRVTRHYNQDSLVMSIIPSMKYAKKDLQTLNQLFIYWMLVKQIIIDTKYDKEDAVRDLAKFCRAQYFTNNDEMKIITEFERTYHKHSPIWWFTRDCFVYVMLSRALQTQDIEIVIRMGFFIKDLNQQLEKLQADAQKTSRTSLTAYQSQNVSNADFDKMKTIKGGLLSFNNFMLAESDYETSLTEARRAQNNDTGITIMFCMKTDSKPTSSPFALLKDISYSPDKGQYVLFSMHSVFRVVDIKEIGNRLWELDLKLTEANNEQVTNLNELIRFETQESSGWFKLAHLMKLVRDFDHAKDIIYALLELIPEEEVLKMAHIYNELGVIEDEMGDFISALLFYQKAIEIRQEHLPPNHRSLSVSYNNLGEVQRQLGDYSSALTSHKKTLDIKRKILPANDLSFATTYNNIGLANEQLGEFPAALAFYQKALDIKRSVLPADHEELAITYNNIGELQRAMGKFQAALTTFEKALQIRLKKCSPTDSSLAIIYNNIGLIYRELAKYPTAVSYLEKSLDIKLKTLPLNHYSLAFTYDNLGDITQQMGEYPQALTFYHRALAIQEKSLPLDHPDLAITYTNIGVSHQAMANYSTALSYYEKAITIRQKKLPPNHPLLGISYNNLGHVYQSTGEYTTALEYYQKTLKLQQTSLESNHPALAATYNNIADIQRKFGNLSKALALYNKSLQIKKSTLPANHPLFIITYNNMGVVHDSLNHYPEALECYKQTLEIQQKTLPPNHPELAAVYNNMGVTHQSMKDYASAIDYYKKALEIQNKSLRPNHPDIAVTHNSMATVLVNLEQYKEALKHSQLAVDIASGSLASDHPHLLTYQNYRERIRIKVESLKSA